MYDILIKNGLVVDGTGKKAFPADVAITKDKIVSIGDLKQETAKKSLTQPEKQSLLGLLIFIPTLTTPFSLTSVAAAVSALVLQPV